MCIFVGKLYHLMRAKKYNRLVRLSLLIFFIQALGFAYSQETILNFDDWMKNMKGVDLVNKGLEYLNEKHMPDSALLCLSVQANRRYTPPKNTVEMLACANAMILIGQVYHDIYHDYQKAYGYFLLSEEYAESHNINKQLPTVRYFMRSIESLDILLNEKDDAALTEIQKMVKLFYEACNTSYLDLTDAIAGSAAISSIRHHLTDSIKAFLLDYCSYRENCKDNIRRNIPYFCKAIIEYDCAKNPQRALEYIDSALANISFSIKVAENIPLMDSIISYQVRCQILLEQSQEKEALETLAIINQLAQRINDHETLFEVYRLFYKYYTGMGKTTMAEKYELLSLKEKDAIVNYCNWANVDATKFLFKIDRMNAEASLMAYRDKMKSLWLWAISIFSAFAVIALFLLYRKYKQIKEMNIQLYNKVQQQLAEMREKKNIMSEQLDFIKETNNKSKYQKNALNENEKSELLHRIFVIMESSDEIFQNGFSLHRLAELVEGNPNYVSQVINEKYHCNFNTLLSEYRIREACKRMNDIQSYGHLTIDAIAASVGIKARSSFISAFKQFTGMTPSSYQKIAKERNGRQ